MPTNITTISAIPIGVASGVSGSSAPVPAVAAVTPVSSDSSGGNLPAGGESVPAATPSTTLGQAVDEINAFLRANARQFLFQIDTATGKGQVTVVNPQTGEIIRQIPDAHALQLAQNIADTGMPLAGMLMDEQA